MFSALAGLINRRPWRVLVLALVITAVAAPLGVHVREYLKPRGFDVADSGSAKARDIIERASGTDPANSVLALVRLSDPVDTPSSRSKVAAVESILHRDPAVVTVLDAHSAHNPAMISRDRHSAYVIAALRPLNDKQQEEAGSRLLNAFAGDPRVTLGGNPVANHEISKTIEDDLRRAELLAMPITGIRWITVDAGSLPASAQAFRADQVINRSTEFVPNGGTPLYLALRAPTSGAGAAAATAVAGRARQLPGVLAAAPPRPLGADTWEINLVSAQRPYSDATQHLVGELGTIKAGYPVFVGGDAAAFRDERRAIGSHLPLAVALLGVATLVILFLLSGSVVAPLLALAMNALTLAAAFGALILIFQDGRFERFLSYTSQGALDLTIPLVLAALVFAISTDYGVFLLSCIREARLRGATDDEAISGGVAVVGRIVTSAAILFAVSIGAFGTSNIIVLKILGVGTALAVLADSLLVRCLLFPAVLRLAGRHAWWLPAPLVRLHSRMGLHEEHQPSTEALPIGT